VSSPRVEVHPDAEALAHAVAGALLERLADTQDAGRAPQVALTGGTIAEAIHERVGEVGGDFEVDWSRVVLWWGDERFVESTSDERNAGSARRSMIDRLPIPAEHVHEAPATGSGLSLDDAAAAYADELRAHGSGSFELVMLGVGPDGHVASLFPGHAALDVDDAIAVGVPDSPKPPPARISLTYAALNRAEAVWFVASGEGKAEAVAKALADDGDLHETPARGVRGQGEVVWFLDREAARLL
jgi:6-phosphogluconolactonase